MPSKQTKRERKEMAKKQRLEEMRRAIRRRRMQRLGSIISVLAVVGLVAGLILWNKSRNDAKFEKANVTINTAALALGCSEVKRPADAGNSHIQPPATGSYTSDPPASGRHYNQGAPNGPAFTGVNPAPLQDEIQVHNLEHGHIGIQYNPTTLQAGVKKALEDFTNKDADWVFMAPRQTPGFKDVVALTAWGRLVDCPAGMKDDPAQATALAQAFYTLYKDKSPHESAKGTPIPKGS